METQKGYAGILSSSIYSRMKELLTEKQNIFRVGCKYFDHELYWNKLKNKISKVDINGLIF